MKTKIIKVTDKGQISIPIDIRNSIGIRNGDELFVINTEDSIVLKKIERANFSDLLKHSEFVANKLWNNEHDDVWDTV